MNLSFALTRDLKLKYYHLLSEEVLTNSNIKKNRLKPIQGISFYF